LICQISEKRRETLLPRLTLLNSELFIRSLSLFAKSFSGNSNLRSAIEFTPNGPENRYTRLSRPTLGSILSDCLSFVYPVYILSRSNLPAALPVPPLLRMLMYISVVISFFGLFAFCKKFLKLMLLSFLVSICCSFPLSLGDGEGSSRLVCWTNAFSDGFYLRMSLIIDKFMEVWLGIYLTYFARFGIITGSSEA